MPADRRAGLRIARSALRGFERRPRAYRRVKTSGVDTVWVVHRIDAASTGVH